MPTFPYILRPLGNTPPTMGLLVLQSDETIEHDFRRLLRPETAKLYVSRVPSAQEVTRESLVAMADELAAAAELFPNAARLAAVGYGCTSATSVIGAKEVARQVRFGCGCDRVTDPLSALVAACGHLGVRNLAFLSPYVEEVSTSLRSTLAAADIQTPVFGSFNEAEETKVANIDQASIVDAAVALARDACTEAVFLSCTNLKTLDVIAEIETAIAKPVLSSNLVLAWHMCRIAGIELSLDGFGRLLAGA